MQFIEYAKCSTCKKAKSWLDAKGIPYECRPIREQNPTAEELKEWHKQSGLPLKRFFNTSGNLYKERNLKDKLKAMGEEEQYRLLAEDGMLVKRPLLVSEDLVLVGFKETEWEEKLASYKPVGKNTMRRQDREIKEFSDIIGVMEKCDVCRLAFHDTQYPYILPLNFGMQVDGDKITLFFHGADQGKKYELLRKDNRVSFEMDCAHRLVMDEEHGNCTMEYESVIGKGILEIVPQEEKEEALALLMEHYHKENFEYNRAVVPQTTVMKLTVAEVSGKRRMKKMP
jgi:hypothetical protein